VVVKNRKQLAKSEANHFGSLMKMLDKYGLLLVSLAWAEIYHLIAAFSVVLLSIIARND
jgi:hypothetical protein